MIVERPMEIVRIEDIRAYAETLLLVALAKDLTRSAPDTALPALARLHFTACAARQCVAAALHSAEAAVELQRIDDARLVLAAFGAQVDELHARRVLSASRHEQFGSGVARGLLELARYERSVARRVACQRSGLDWRVAPAATGDGAAW